VALTQYVRSGGAVRVALRQLDKAVEDAFRNALAAEVMQRQRLPLSNRDPAHHTVALLTGDLRCAGVRGRLFGPITVRRSTHRAGDHAVEGVPCDNAPILLTNSAVRKSAGGRLPSPPEYASVDRPEFTGRSALPCEAIDPWTFE
jgi:hypothetical protein